VIDILQTKVSDGYGDAINEGNGVIKSKFQDGSLDGFMH